MYSELCNYSSFILYETNISTYKEKFSDIYVIDPFSYKSTITEIKIGPFLINNTKFYCFNASMIYDENDDMIIITRMCEQIHPTQEHDKYPASDFKNDPYLNSSLEKYSNNYTNNYSFPIYFKMKDPNSFKLIDNYMINNYNRFGIQDCRLFKYNNKIWVYGHCYGESSLYPIIFEFYKSTRVIKLTMEKMGNTEKNWMPFEYNNELYFVYKTTPHIILKCDIDTGICKILYQSENNIKESMKYKISHIGGNTPPILINIENKKYYLAISHISYTLYVRKSFFYIFNAEPPFDIKKYSKLFNIITEYYAPIEFICGLVVKDDKVIISSGINDCYNVLCEISLYDIINSMIDI